MDSHQNASLTPRGRALMVGRVLDHGHSYRAVAKAFGVDPKTVRRWVARYQAEGLAGLQERSSRPLCQPGRVPGGVARQIRALRRERWTMGRIAERTGYARASVARVLRRAGLNRLRALEPVDPPQRYEHEQPGDLLHLDIKTLGRFNEPGHRVTGIRRKRGPAPGRESMHVAIDDHSRLSFAELRKDATADSAVAHLYAAVRYYERLGVTIRRVLTDNGACYRSRTFERACSELGIRHRFTRPFRPQTNGKAERFIQTALREWAYGFRYTSSQQRAEHLPRWLHDYNWHRPHGSLNRRTPISILGLPEDNLVRLHT